MFISDNISFHPFIYYYDPYLYTSTYFFFFFLTYGMLKKELFFEKKI
jgi:hypothetical protein